MRPPTSELQSLLDALYPPRCLVCGVALPSVEPSLCASHALHGSLRPQACPRCAAHTSPHVPATTLCPGCRSRPPGFSRTRALGVYAADSSLREWVLRFKHAGRRDLAAPLGEALGELLAEEPGEWREGTLLVPVPLHSLRRLERGYDQALLLARAISRSAGLPVSRALRRLRYTPAQGSPGQRSRSANVHTAFGTRRAVRGLRDRSVWLVDDVLTSGATASECARVLRRAGAARVGLLVVARAASPLADS